MITEKTSETRDSWDEHWNNLNEITQQNPSQHYRHQLILDRIRDLTLIEGKVGVIDFGSGQGDLIALLHKHFPQNIYLGVELSGSGVSIAKTKVPQAIFIQADLLAGGIDTRSLQSVTQVGICAEVLEHVDNPERVLKSIMGCLPDGATLVVTVPKGPMNEFEKYIGHRRHYSETELRRLLESVGFTDVQTTSAGFPFFNIYKLLGWLRGKKVIADAAAKRQGTLVKLVFYCFSILFKLNLERSPWGWQLLASCRASNRC